MFSAERAVRHLPKALIYPLKKNSDRIYHFKRVKCQYNWAVDILVQGQGGCSQLLCVQTISFSGCWGVHLWSANEVDHFEIRQDGDFVKRAAKLMRAPSSVGQETILRRTGIGLAGPEERLL